MRLTAAQMRYRREVGNALARWLHAVSRSQRWLAVECGVSDVVVSRWIGGETLPAERHRPRLAELGFEMPVEAV